MGDDEGSSLRDIREHRVFKDGHYYLVARISHEDARARGIVVDDDLIRLFNNRGSVVCAAQVTDRLRPGVVGIDGLGRVPPGGEPGRSTDLGGCINMLNPSKAIAKETHGIRPNTTLDTDREMDRGRHLAAAGGDGT